MYKQYGCNVTMHIFIASINTLLFSIYFCNYQNSPRLNFVFPLQSIIHPAIHAIECRRGKSKLLAVYTRPIKNIQETPSSIFNKQPDPSPKSPSITVLAVSNRINRCPMRTSDYNQTPQKPIRIITLPISRDFWKTFAHSTSISARSADGDTHAALPCSSIAPAVGID